MSLEADASYQRYKSLSREELHLPVPDTNSDSEVIVEAGEIFCRIQGCTENRRFRFPYLLRKHLQKAHPDVAVERAPIGKPTKRDADRARGFYRGVIDAYDARHAAATQVAEGANKAEGDREDSQPEDSKKEEGSVKPAAKRRRLE